jgi:diacylglycerol kinase family enzyme
MTQARSEPPPSRRPAALCGRPLPDRRVVLYCKPSARDARNPERLASRLRDRGHAVRVTRLDHSSPPPDPTSELVLAAGGDGTVAKAARWLNGSGVPLVIFPCGTANNLAAALGITEATDPEAALAGVPRTIDLGLARGPWGERAFVESLGVGALAAAGRTVHEAAERGGGYGPEGKIARARRAFAAALDAPPPFDGTLMPPDGASVQAEPFAFVEICNVCRTGPGILLAPAADPSDGVFDIVLGDARTSAAARRACGTRDWPAALDTPPTARRWNRLGLTCRLDALRIDGKFGTELVATPDDRTHAVSVTLLPAALCVVVPPSLRMRR